MSLLWLVCVLLLLLPVEAVADQDVWSLLKVGKQVVLIRHAAKETDCLSSKGREDARRLGHAFRAHGVVVEEVRSSPSCRCRETATLAFGAVTSWPPLASFEGALEREAEQTGALREVIRRHNVGVMVLVTHNFNIVALTGIYLAEGDGLVLTPERGGFRVAGRLTP